MGGGWKFIEEEVFQEMKKEAESEKQAKRKPAPRPAVPKTAVQKT